MVAHATETSAAQDSAARGCAFIGGWSYRFVVEALMVALDVMVVEIFVKELPEVLLAQRNDAV